jgi:hypothetical protein
VRLAPAPRRGVRRAEQGIDPPDACEPQRVMSMIILFARDVLVEM